jgi:hypothetical protein
MEPVGHERLASQLEVGVHVCGEGAVVTGDARDPVVQAEPGIAR